MQNQQAAIDIARLSALAEAWLRLLQSECPHDWRRLLPDININSPDRILEPRSLPVSSTRYVPEVNR